MNIDLEINSDKATIADVYKLLVVLKKQNSVINDRLEKIEESVSKEAKEVNKKIEILEEENNKLKFQLQQIGRQQKKYNLVIYGVNEEKNDLYQTVKEIMEINLGLNLNLRDIRDVVRIGKVIGEKPRPILLELISYPQKQEILRSAKKLKGTGIYISPDLTKQELEDKKILTSNLVAAREKQYSAKIVRNTLIVNGEIYDVNALKQNPLYEYVSNETSAPTTPILREINSAPATPSTADPNGNRGELSPIRLNSGRPDKKRKNLEQKQNEAKGEQNTETIAERLVKKRKENSAT